MDLDPNIFGAGQPCFGCAPDHPTGFRLRFARENDTVVTRFTPSGAYQGPPGLMHGGLVMTLADEIGAWAILGGLGKFGFTAQFSGRLRKPVRIGHEVIGRGTIKKPGSRVVTVAVTLEQAAERVLDAELGFVLVDASGAEQLLGAPLPEAWRAFVR
jgi:acyl-coenzyme A thioesterase PaaI-like protein